jgi:tripartite-type tricarboxylate transporter receptor subunit TctC
LHLASSAAALPVLSRIARAQTYPTQAVRLVVPFAAGAVNDITARLIGRWLSERLGQPFIIENRPGGGANIGIEAVVRAPADGYTLLVIGTTAAINATLFEKLNYNFIRDIAPVASIIRVPHVMQVNPSLPVTTVPEFIAYAKANPGKISMGSGGNGSPAHVIGEHFKMMTGVNLVHVPYRGGAPALTDLIGGQIQVAFIDMAGSIEYIRAGKLRALAVTTATRSEALPDIPTIGDFVPGFEASQWVGLGAPKNTRSEIIGKLNTEINAGLVDPKLKARFADLGGTVLPGSAADFGKLIADDTEKWGKVIKFSGAKPE